MSFATIDADATDQSVARTHGSDTLFFPRSIEVKSRTTSYLPPGNVRCGLSDKTGNMWFGTWEGIVRYDPSASLRTGGRSFTLFTQQDSASEERGYADWENVFTIFEDRSGNIWFGALRGVYRYDGHAFTSFVIPEGAFKDPNSSEQDQVRSRIFRTTVLSIIQDKHGNLWFGTHGAGVYRYDGTSLTGLSTTNGLCNNVVQDIVEDSTGNLWFATRGGGVCRYDPSALLGTGGRSFTSFKAEDMVGNHVFFISSDKTGVHWIGTVGGGLRRYDGKTFASVTELHLLNATAMLETSTGDRWFTSDGSGAVRYDPSASLKTGGRSYTRVTTKEGLCANSVWSIVEDKAGNLWFCTRSGLCRYDGRSFTSFTE